jgi:predicted ATPase/class 3 adenylate cyclase
MQATRMARTELPTGTVTFLLTDVEGSTRLLGELGAAAYGDALGEHRRVLREAFAANGGVEVDTQGDALFIAFPTAAGAVEGARQAQDALSGGLLPVRMGMHTGTPHVTAEGYVGRDVHLAARIAAAGHGGQMLLSRRTRDLVEGDFADLGEHRLKDFAEPVSIFQVGTEEFPPLKTISNTNLPRPASSFVGRRHERDELTSLVTSGVRFITLTGPGGSGKSRLAIEAASELVPEFKAGVFWVGLASLNDPALVAETIGRALGARNGVADHIGERELLLLLDNLEHLVAAAPELAVLVEMCPNLSLLVTSRERLRVRGEREYSVSPLPEEEAVELFCARAQTDPDESVCELCRALDNLPLALELAASRATVLSPRQMLARLGQRLDLLKGGRDAELRQQTLRATIEWSHELLAEQERRVFAGLSVFVGGCTIDAAAAVVQADVDTLQSLVEKSLLRHSDERFWMLQTIREYAAERLEKSGETRSLRERHARCFLELARREDAQIRAGEPEEGPVAVLERELVNLRAAVEFGLETGDTQLVREITAALPMYWEVRGRYVEARAWLERAVALDDAEDETRRRLLSALGRAAYELGDYPAAVNATDAAANLAGRLGGATDRIDHLREQGLAAIRAKDFAQAETLSRKRLAAAMAVDNGVAISSCRLSLAYIANKTRRYADADDMLAENLPFVRGKGQARCEAFTLASIAETAILSGRAQACADDALLAATRALQIRDKPLAVYSLELFAACAAARGESQRAGTILGATEAAREEMETPPDEDEEAIRALAFQLLNEDAALESAWAEGRTIDLASALIVAQR